MKVTGLGHIIGLCAKCNEPVLRRETSKAYWAGKRGWVVEHINCERPYTQDIGEPWRGEAK